MLLSIFAVYDSGIKAWLPPIYARNKGEMLRSFTDACSNPESKFFKYPGDYALFELGTWDDEKCVFDILKSPVRLFMALDFVKPPADKGGLGGLVPPGEASS